MCALPPNSISAVYSDFATPHSRLFSPTFLFSTHTKIIFQKQNKTKTDQHIGNVATKLNSWEGPSSCLTMELRLM